MTTIRAAGIDCGTNSVRLLIADIDPETGRAQDVDRQLRIVRLGQGVDATGHLAPAALARTFSAVRKYGADCRRNGVEAIRMVATSATRDADNATEFVAGVRAILGVDPEVVDGIEEAALAFAGALGTVCGTPPYLVVDVGGGSTELVLGAEAPLAAYSMNVGSVRITERHLRSAPPTRAQVAAAAADVDSVLKEARAAVDFANTATLVGVAGTVTSVTAYTLGLTRYDPAQIHGAVLCVDAVQSACRALWSMSRAELMALGFLEPGRVDVIGGGALVWSRVLHSVHDAVAAAGGSLTSVLTSEHDILDGVALSAARRCVGLEG
ncbi:MAG: Ppx/GppA family phosphatase [Bifidobacteriaceae bacterium]|nr:Ppx/GppA family phosphatase [Bifidobacteriaceae bacterium]